MRIGIDLGGTKIETIILDETGSVIARNRQPTKRGDYQDIVNQIASVVRFLEADIELKPGRVCTVGLGIPGSVSAVTGLVRNANTTELNGQPLKKDIEIALKRSVSIANDANCLILSEATDGAAQGVSSAFGVIIGTGTGGAIWVNGQLLSGFNGIAGEWGHNPLPWMTENEYPGSVCYCGKKGCIETFLSGPGMAEGHFQSTGDRLTAQQISDFAASGNVKEKQTLNLYMDRLARSLAHICNLIDPEVIVLGGGLSGIDELYQRIPKLIEQYAFADQLSVKLMPAMHGDSSGVRGAAWLPAMDLKT